MSDWKPDILPAWRKIITAEKVADTWEFHLIASKIGFHFGEGDSKDKLNYLADECVRALLRFFTFMKEAVKAYQESGKSPKDVKYKDEAISRSKETEKPAGDLPPA